MKKVLAGVLLVTVVTGLACEALGQTWAESPLGKTKFGEVWLGEGATSDDLAGRVVLLEFWGYRCPICIGYVPQMNKWNTKYAKSGLVVISAHAQGPAKKEALDVATKEKMNYVVYSNASVPGKMTFKTLPHALVFDPHGEVVYEGTPTDPKMTTAIETALKKCPQTPFAWLLADMEYRRLASAVALVKGGALGRAMAECEKAKDKEGDAGLEARTLAAALDKYEKKLEATAKDRAESPSAAQGALQALKARFAGTENATKAEAELAALAKDEAFQKELKAEADYKLIAGALEKASGSPREKSALVQKVKARIEQMKKTWPDSPFIGKAEAALQNFTADK